MKTSEMKDSKFLRKEDVGAGMLFTVEGIERHNVAMQGAEEELRWCMRLTEAEKTLVMNSTNVQLCEKIFGSDDTDDWIGKKIVLFTDPNVSYAGKLVGGIRVRAPKLKPTAIKSVAAKPVRAVGTIAKPAAEMPVEIEPDFDGDDSDPDAVPF